LLLVISIMATVIATGIGGIIGVKIGRLENIGKILAFAGGIMISIVAFEIVPEAINLSNLFLVVFFIFTGIILVEVVERIVNHYDDYKETSIKRTGVILLVVIGLHNFPEGLAIGASGANSHQVALILGLVVAIHDISEGMAIAVPLQTAGLGKGKTIFCTFISGATTIVGALIGLFLGKISLTFSSITLAIAGGAMLYVVYLEIIPESLNYESPKKVAISTIIGIIIGLIIVTIY